MQVEMALKKDVLRKKFISLRNSLSQWDVEQKSYEIASVFLKTTNVDKFRRFLLYLPINNEVQTQLIIDHLVLENKEVYVPKFFKGVWQIAKFKNWDDLEKGPFGILQPKGRESINHLDVAVVPGVAFDKRGVRLGYGKGVYDKLLADFKGLKIGLAYDFQIVGRLPWQKHDLLMDLVIAQKRVFDFKTTLR